MQNVRMIRSTAPLGACWHKICPCSAVYVGNGLCGPGCSQLREPALENVRGAGKRMLSNAATPWRFHREVRKRAGSCERGDRVLAPPYF
jgi:hypothetical protein